MIDLNHIRPDDLPEEFREIVDAIGLASALRLVELRGGESVYIPKAERIAITARNRAIAAEFNGSNHRELAKKHGLTVTWIRQITGARQKSGTIDQDQKQLDLF